ncbi:MAG TPA: helix-turn-helix domain-containing protein [Ktedonobacterales bacterium]|jgi:excisionase family DNA binding protein|nr:helix-turn-helix domain-containing protein [Ktedonobacterales bacterium]
MATDTDKLMERAVDAQRRLEAQGLHDEARVMLDLIAEIQALQPQSERQFCTTAEAGRLIGVTPQTIKNWVARGLLAGYRLGGRIVIPRAALDEYRDLGAAMRAIEPLPPIEEIVRDIRAGRRPVKWPASGDATVQQPGTQE